MTSSPRIVGYGLCGSGEADKYLEIALKEFERLCDETIILLNNAGDKEKQLIEKYGFKTVEDDREWGQLQWKIKEDFVKNHVAKLNPDLCVCIDMDEQFDSKLTKEKLIELYSQPFDAFAFHIVDLWDDGYLPELSFWNIRVWKFKPKRGLNFAQKNLHCGLGPEWTWSQHYFAPYMLKHYGLKEKAVRQKKVERYKKYDPKAKWLSLQAGYYQILASDKSATPFDEDKKHQEIEDFVIKTNQKYTEIMDKKQEEVAYIRLKNGMLVPVPKDTVKHYIAQGLEYVADYKEPEKIELPAKNELECPICGYVAKAKIGLIAHKKRHV